MSEGGLCRESTVSGTLLCRLMVSGILLPAAKVFYLCPQSMLLRTSQVLNVVPTPGTYNLRNKKSDFVRL